MSLPEPAPGRIWHRRPRSGAIGRHRPDAGPIEGLRRASPYHRDVLDEGVWDRRRGESQRAHRAFRVFRDLGPMRTLDDVTGESPRTIAKWSRTHGWRERAEAWDDEAHRLEDRARLEAIRTMHETHQRLARAMLSRALQALNGLRPEDLTPHAVARMIELGTRLERQTLLTSVDDLVRRAIEPTVEPPEVLSPLQRIALELEGVA